MFGQIHCIVRELVEVHFGPDKWAEILEDSGMNDIHFLSYSVFDDSTTFRLIESASRVLGIPYDTVLKELGNYFLTYHLKHGYDKMLLTLGQDMYTLIQNLDSLHSMLSQSYRGILSPSFRCQENEDGTLTVHHYSWRKGMYPVVQGLMEMVGSQLFNQVATVTLLKTSKKVVDDGKFMYHTSMTVELQSRSSGHSLVTGGRPMFESKLARRKMPVDMRTPPQGGTKPLISTEDLCMAFPYHIVMDEDLHILQCGDNIRRLIPFAISSSTTLPDIAAIRQPVMSPTANLIISFINSIFFIDIHPQHKHPFGLKGQMMFLPCSKRLMFVGSPLAHTLTEMNKAKIFMDDYALYDPARELVLVNQQHESELEMAMLLDDTILALDEVTNAVEEVRAETEGLLHELMPAKVAKQLHETGHSTAERHEWSTVLFTSITTFADIAIGCAAEQVVSMLTEVFQRFDNHAGICNVYSVNTMGDAYMAVTGVHEEQENHAQKMANFAMDIVEDAANVLSPATGLPLQIRVGMHSGAVLAGVIGEKKPQFCIWGDTVDTASCMERGSVAGRILVSNTTFEKLFVCDYVFKSRGEIEVKGKGRMNTYFLTGTMNRDLEQPDDEFTSRPDLFDSKEQAEVRAKRKAKGRKPKTSPPVNMFVLKSRLMSLHSSQLPVYWQSHIMAMHGENPQLQDIMGPPSSMSLAIPDSHHVQIWPKTSFSSAMTLLSGDPSQSASLLAQTPGSLSDDSRPGDPSGSGLSDLHERVSRILEHESQPTPRM